MNKSGRNIFIVSMAALFWVSASFAAPPVKSMPPAFSYSNDPADVLHEYPLGTITMQEAFAHHGAPVRKVTLPNGLPGWLYKAGEKEGVPSIYVLVLSPDDIVIDVLHKDYRYRIGHSALQYQYLQHIEAEIQTLGPGPGQQ